MTTPYVHPLQQTASTYTRMATEAKYRPAAPSDGMGTITTPLAELDLATEARTYAESWRREEKSLEYMIGCPSYEDRPALILIIEAARLLCGVERQGAAHLLRMALANLEATR
ncbi:MAG: hypothetical protein ACTH6A_11110 [Brachybacterium tyrofermentans]|uniref:hypothetical protein n=1 Tax=Brachybacterium tyrofermentans TaxID=47848 RepID=UPI003F8FCB68